MIGLQTGDILYSILLTPSLFSVLLFESKLVISHVLIVSVFERLDGSATGNDRRLSSLGLMI
jgi:hypothetical protein